MQEARLLGELVLTPGTPKLDKPAEATPVVPAPEAAQLDRPAEKRRESAELSEDSIEGVGSETGDQRKMMRLSDEVSVVTGLHGQLWECQCQTG